MKCPKSRLHKVRLSLLDYEDWLSKAAPRQASPNGKTRQQFQTEHLYTVMWPLSISRYLLLKINCVFFGGGGGLHNCVTAIDQAFIS